MECKRLGLTELVRGTQPLIGVLCGCQACTQRSKYSGMQLLYVPYSKVVTLDLSELTPCVTRSVPELAVTINKASPCQICQPQRTYLPYMVNRHDMVSRISQAPKSSHRPAMFKSTSCIKGNGMPWGHFRADLHCIYVAEIWMVEIIAPASSCPQAFVLTHPLQQYDTADLCGLVQWWGSSTWAGYCVY